MIGAGSGSGIPPSQSMVVDEEEGTARSRGYEQTKLNKIRVYKHRAHYDFETIHNITDSTLVSHVSFVIRGGDNDGEVTPAVMPLTAVLGRYDEDNDDEEICEDGEGDGEGGGGGDDGSAEMIERRRQKRQKTREEAMRSGPMELYLHGNAAAMLCRAIRESGTGEVRVCVCSTKVDGIVLFPTPNGHSLNYRSATLHGVARLVPNTQIRKKRWAMRLLTNHMFRDRWEATYPVAESAVEKVQVIEVQVISASAKIRTGNTGPFDAGAALEAVRQDEKNRMDHGQQRGRVGASGACGVWAGVVPLFETMGSPLVSREIDGIGGDDDDDNDGGLKMVESWRGERNRREQMYAVDAASAGY